MAERRQRVERRPIEKGPGEGPIDETPIGETPIGKAQPEGAHRHPERAPLELERLIHERMRLGIISALAVNDSLTFKDLKSLLRATDGNLSVHARKLEEAGYVRCEKSFQDRVPHTVYRLTPPGRDALERYLGHMEAIIDATRNG